jgi:hypothetical protein
VTRTARRILPIVPMEVAVRKPLLVPIGAVLALVGGVWTFQGLGYLTGSPMTGVAAWAIIGPLVAGLGVALVIVGVRGHGGRT